VISRVLAAVDRSPRADDVFASGADLARAFGAELHVVRVLEVPPEFPPAAHVSGADQLPALLNTEAEADLRALSASRPDVAPAAHIIMSAQPWRAILDLGRELDADIVVIGTHARHGIERILGTTASKVVSHADRSVFVVQRRAGRQGL
jgi:nucleotide-binding universal stress UspA family protein